MNEQLCTLKIRFDIKILNPAAMHMFPWILVYRVFVTDYQLRYMQTSPSNRRSELYWSCAAKCNSCFEICLKSVSIQLVLYLHRYHVIVDTLTFWTRDTSLQVTNASLSFCLFWASTYSIPFQEKAASEKKRRDNVSYILDLLVFDSFFGISTRFVKFL